MVMAVDHHGITMGLPTDPNQPLASAKVPVAEVKSTANRPSIRARTAMTQTKDLIQLMMEYLSRLRLKKTQACTHIQRNIKETFRI